MRNLYFIRKESIRRCFLPEAPGRGTVIQEDGMDANRTSVMEKAVYRAVEHLERNNMKAMYVPNAEAAAAAVQDLLEEECTIALGGSMTLQEAGVIDMVRQGRYNLIDRYEPGLTAEELHERFIKACSADVFLTGVNAVTEHGELYNVDCVCNRVAPMLFGPRKVIIVTGWQKIVPTLQDAVNRVKRIAGPANAKRLNRDAPCIETGLCVVPQFHEKHLMSIPVGACDAGVCCSMVVMGRQHVKNRVHVVIAGEMLGY